MLWLIIVLLIALLGVLMYLFPLIQVCGDSMKPTFNDGDIILGCRLFSMKVGSVYVYHPPIGEKYVIKRLTIAGKSRDKYFFEGDNSSCSYDSRMYGCVSKSKMVAKYVLTIHKRKECSNNGSE